ncbi:bis(5'-nucleosyl)-tetraphosphatase (symmetrical) YqeK [Alkalihalobacterium elongatum]|uniref:bis(5'-nucleosyl)-tetraphosphatase (symmetrical) YqeK n=1 Tax=Alkalihalobacterium elongatum TaxID=2675466 RepID=UPI001C1F51B3|nr:bis(5'-nucleosyl)-tetraphosphatase (symmetrical) YqeK [Alkalihalobacterium elongatum]
MERAQALEIVKPHLTDHRYTHTIGVMETAIQLAKQQGIDEEKAELASIFHDYAKFRPKDEMRQLIREQNLGDDFLHYGNELLHAPCGAYWVEHEVGIKDDEILSAIRYHTTGRPNMTTLEKVVFLADYIEPGRQFPGVEEVRETAANDLNYACIMSLRNTMTFLMKKSQLIYPDTLAAYNQLLTEWKKGR